MAVSAEAVEKDTPRGCVPPIFVPSGPPKIFINITLESCLKCKAETDREHFPKELARMPHPRIAAHFASGPSYPGIMFRLFALLPYLPLPLIYEKLSGEKFPKRLQKPLLDRCCKGTCVISVQKSIYAEGAWIMPQELPEIKHNYMI